MLIARTTPKPRSDVDDGTFYNEWQLRRADVRDLERNVAVREKIGTTGFVIERRHVRTLKGLPDTIGEWEIVEAGETPATALEAAWESQLDTAESLSDVHPQMVAYMAEARARAAAAADRVKDIQSWLNVLPEQAQRTYEHELLKTGLLHKARRGKVPPEQITAIKERVRVHCAQVRHDLMQQLDAANKACDEARAFTFVQWQHHRHEARLSGF